MRRRTAIFGVMAEFREPEQILRATRQARAAGYTVMDAYTPYPVEGLADGVRRGAGLAQPMAEARAFPALAVHMVRVGEETGRLEDTLLQVATSLETDTRKLVKRLVDSFPVILAPL